MTETTPTEASDTETTPTLIPNGIYSRYGLVFIATDPHNAYPFIMQEDSSPTPADDAMELIAAPGDEEWVTRMVRLRGVLLSELRTDRTNLSRLRTHLDELGEALKDEAERRGWCSEYDDFAEEWDLPRRNREYDVTMTVRVRAADEDEARDLVTGEVGISAYGYSSHEWVVESPDYSVSEVD